MNLLRLCVVSILAAWLASCASYLAIPVRIQGMVFQKGSIDTLILNEELDLSRILVCAQAIVRDSAPEYCSCAYTDSLGKFDLTLVLPHRVGEKPFPYYWGGVKLMVEDPTCGNLLTRDDIEESNLTIYPKSFWPQLGRYEEVTEYLDPPKPFNIHLPVLEKETISLQKDIDYLLKQSGSMRYTEIVSSIDALVGESADFTKKYPQSSRRLKDRILVRARANILDKARGLVASEDYRNALVIYDHLIEDEENKDQQIVAERENVNRQLRKQNEIDSLNAYVAAYSDSLIAMARKMSNFARAIVFLRSERKKAPLAEIATRLDESIYFYENEAERQREEAEEARLRTADAIALKRFRVNMSVDAIDFFKNPFAFRNEHIILTCLVDRFVAPRSAFMNSLGQFHATFMVEPPKEFRRLHVIAKVKGVIDAVNSYGATIKIPSVDIVYIFHFPPEAE